MKKILSPINLRNDVRNSLQEYFIKYLDLNMTVYDVGCGDKPFSNFLKGKVEKHIGVDIKDGFYDQSHIDIFGKAYDIPVEDDVADAIISSQVIEHLDKPIEKTLEESRRILKKGGILFLAFPFMYPIHAAPHDYVRYTEFYMEKVLTEHKFEIIEKKHIGGFWYCTGMFMGLYLQNFDRGLLKTLRITKLLIWLVKFIMRAMHELEGLMLRIAKKDQGLFRSIWTVDYILVCRNVGT